MVWKKDWYRKVLISLQPDNVDDEEFDYTKDAVIVEIIKGAVVSKGQFADLKKLEEKWKNDGMNVEYEDSSPYEKYYIMMAVPSCVALFGLGMYIFVMINNKNIDLSHLKKRQSAGRKTTHRRIPFKRRRLRTRNYRSIRTMLSRRLINCSLFIEYMIIYTY